MTCCSPAHCKLACAVVVLTLLLAGCASQTLRLGSQPATDPEARLEAEAGGAQTADPIAQKAAALLQSTNQYQRTRQPLNPAQRQRASAVMEKMEQRDWGQAQALLEPLLQTDAASSLHVLAGDIAQGRGSAAQAIDAYQRAIAKNRNNLYAHNRLAMLYRQAGQFDQALTHYDLALEAWPGFASAYRNRGILRDLYTGQKQQALTDYLIYQQLLRLTQSTSVKTARQVKAWLADLQRQIDSQTKNSKAQQEVARVPD